MQRVVKQAVLALAGFVRLQDVEVGHQMQPSSIQEVQL
jgi:hypothetical protein